MSRTETSKIQLTVGDRYFIDGKPATILAQTATGFTTVHYDGRNFKTFIQSDEIHEYEKTEMNEAEALRVTVQDRAAALGIKI